MRKTLRFLILFFIVSFSFSSPCWAATIRVNTPKVIVSLAPGTTHSDEIVFENPTDKEMGVRIYLEDWKYLDNATGEKVFSPAGSTPLSAAKWIDFSPADAVLPPFSRNVARFTVRVPEDAQGGHYAVLFFETILGVQQDADGANVLVSGRVGSLFFIESGSVDRKGVVQSVIIEPPAGNSPMVITTTFQNAGNTDITVSGNFLLMNNDSQVVGRGELSKIFTFPGDQATVKSEWVGRLSPGQYQMILTYDLGKGQAIVEEKNFTVAA